MRNLRNNFKGDLNIMNYFDSGKKYNNFYRIKRKIRYYLNYFERIFQKLRVKILWLIFSHKNNWKGVTNTGYDKTLIISLTSYPKRFKDVIHAIRSLMLQTLKANKIILWLSYEEVPEQDKQLPKKLFDLKRFGLEIKYCKNMRSFNKLLPTLELYPNADVVTADDDIYYRADWLKELYETHLKFPDDVCVHRMMRYYIYSDGKIDVTDESYIKSYNAEFTNHYTGVGGYCIQVIFFIRTFLDRKFSPKFAQQMMIFGSGLCQLLITLDREELKILNLIAI